MTECTRIVRAGVQFVPDPAHIPTVATARATSTGRARPADDPSSTVISGQPVDAVHRALRTTTSAGVEGLRSILSKANQALATLERYKLRLDGGCGTLSELETEDGSPHAT